MHRSAAHWPLATFFHTFGVVLEVALRSWLRYCTGTFHIFGVGRRATLHWLPFTSSVLAHAPLHWLPHIFRVGCMCSCTGYLLSHLRCWRRVYSGVGRVHSWGGGGGRRGAAVDLLSHSRLVEGLDDVFVIALDR